MDSRTDEPTAAKLAQAKLEKLQKIQVGSSIAIYASLAVNVRTSIFVCLDYSKEKMVVFFVFNNLLMHHKQCSLQNLRKKGKFHNFVVLILDKQTNNAQLNCPFSVFSNLGSPFSECEVPELNFVKTYSAINHFLFVVILLLHQKIHTGLFFFHF